MAAVEVVEEYLDPEACWTDGERMFVDMPLFLNNPVYTVFVSVSCKLR